LELFQLSVLRLEGAQKIADVTGEPTPLGVLGAESLDLRERSDERRRGRGGWGRTRVRGETPGGRECIVAI
jgi:hypothetical protein